MDKELEKQLDRDYKYARFALSWSGWGSPVGLGIGLMSIGVFLWMLRLAHIIH